MKLRHKAALKVVPAQDVRGMMCMGLEGARYHFYQIQAALKSPGVATGWTAKSVIDEQERVQLQRDINRFHWHLRAFFWELVAEMDLLRVVVKKSPMSDRTKLMEDLRRAYDAAWFAEVRTYRNFAHQSLLFVQCSYKGPPPGELEFAYLLPAIEGQSPTYDLLAQLSGYLEKMERLLKTRQA